jgi:general secretion pathway protein G
MRRAFTLIEVLVVISIIAIVAAILLPVIARVKAEAKKTACLSNLSQIGKAMLMYMTDYDDLFPYGLDPVDKNQPVIWSGYPAWYAEIPYMPMLHEVLQPYIRSREVFHCPSDTGSEVVDNQFPLVLKSSPSMFATFGSSYFYRTELAFRRQSHSSMQYPAWTNVSFDGCGHWHSLERMLRPYDSYPSAWSLVKKYRYNVLYCDMHVKSGSYDTLTRAWRYPP